MQHFETNENSTIPPLMFSNPSAEQHSNEEKANFIPSPHIHHWKRQQQIEQQLHHVTKSANYRCLRWTMIGICVCLPLSVCLFLFCLLSTAPALATFFGLNYPEIQRQQNWELSLATVRNLTANAHVCCEKECLQADQCYTCLSEWPACGTEQPANASAGETIDCCNGYRCCSICCDRCNHCTTSESGEEECRSVTCNCKCCKDTRNHACSWKCSECYTPKRIMTYPVDSESVISVTDTKDCGQDKECMDEFISRLKLGSTHNVWYNPDNKTEFAFSVEQSWWRWLITGWLSVTPLLFAYTTLLSCTSWIMCCVVLYILLFFTDMWRIFLRSWSEKVRQRQLSLPKLPQKRKLRSNVSSVQVETLPEEEKIEDQPSNRSITPPLNDEDWDLEMYRELLVAPVSEWDMRTVNVWIHIMGWAKYQENLSYVGEELLSTDYFNDSRACKGHFLQNVFKGDRLQMELFFSAIRLIRLYSRWWKQERKSPATDFWNQEIMTQFLREEELHQYASALRQRHIHLFFLLESTPEQLRATFQSNQEGFGSRIFTALRKFVQRMRLDSEMLETYLKMLHAEENTVLPCFQLVEQICAVHQLTKSSPLMPRDNLLEPDLSSEVESGQPRDESLPFVPSPPLSARNQE